MVETNTHRRYGTIKHVHLDWHAPDDPVDLHAVETGDGRWFLEATGEGEAAEIWQNAPEICDRFAEPFREPTFHSTFDDAARLADRLYHQILGRPAGEILDEYGISPAAGRRFMTIEVSGLPVWVCRPDDALDLTRFVASSELAIESGATWRTSTPREINKWCYEYQQGLAQGQQPDALFAVEPPV